MSSKETTMELKTKGTKREEGFVLVLTMLFMLVLTLIGVSAVNTTTYENGISGNLRISKEAFYIAEAGLHEFMGRFRTEATGEITDANPSSPDWKLFLAPNTERAAKVGYDSSNPNHIFIQSLQNEMDYGVEIEHKVDASNNVLTWAGFPVYIAKSHGFTVQRGNKVIEAEINKVPDIDPPASLYSKSPVTVSGNSTYITGVDTCPIGGVPKNKPGVMTTASTIIQNGLPTMDGSPPTVTNSSTNVPLTEMVTYFKDSADFTYEYSTDTTLTGYSDGWGQPTSNGAKVPLSYTGQMNVVYFNMQGTNALTLGGGCHGAGVLLVNGDLKLNGGFSWYGVIIVTGNFTFHGGGEKNITGGALGDQPSVGVGGDVTILYCSNAVKQLRDRLQWAPLRMAQWRQIY
jgi:hypothetical protein